MRLAYCTWGMMKLDVDEALPGIARIGYRAIELAVTPGRPSDLYTFDVAKRARTARLLREHGLALTAVAGHTSMCEDDAEKNRVNNVSAREAYEQWKAAPDKVKILDVRTPEEYICVGHPTMAWKVPVVAVSYLWDEDKGQFPMRPLADFVSRVQTFAKPEDTLMVMCRSGGRSAIAVNMLDKAGLQGVQHRRWHGRGSGQGSGQRIPGPAVEERLEERGLPVDLRAHSRPDAARRTRRHGRRPENHDVRDSMPLEPAAPGRRWTN